MSRFAAFISGFTRRLSFSAAGVYQLWVTVLKVIESLIVCCLALASILWLLQLVPDFSYTIKHWIPVGLRDQATFLGLLQVSFVVSVCSIICCLMMALLARLFYLTRFVYDLLGTVGRLALFFIPFVLLQGMVLEQLFDPIKWWHACLLGSVPAVLLFHGCLMLAKEFIPELGALIRSFFSKEKKGAPWTQQHKSSKHSQKVKSLDQQHANVLGLSGKVTFEDVKRQYHIEARKYHPDKVLHLGAKLQEAAEIEMRAINEAYHYFEKQYKKRQR